MRIGVSGRLGESWALLGLTWIVLRRSRALRISGGDITCARHPWPTVRLLARSSIPQLPFTPPSPLPPLGPKAFEAPKNVIQERPSKAYSNEPSQNTKTAYSCTENTINRKNYGGPKSQNYGGPKSRKYGGPESPHSDQEMWVQEGDMVSHVPKVYSRLD